MDPDPALAVTLSAGRQADTCEIVALGRTGVLWRVVEPGAPRGLVVGLAGALETRRRLTRRTTGRATAAEPELDARSALGADVGRDDAPPKRLTSASSSGMLAR